MGADPITIAAVASLAATAYSTMEQQKQAQKAAKRQKEARAISGAEQQTQQMEARRQQIREERIRRSQIIQASENTGVSLSSGEIGSVGALGTSTEANLSSMNRQANAAAGIGYQTQKAADAQATGQKWAAIGGISSSIFGTAIQLGAFQNKPEQPQPKSTEVKSKPVTLFD